MADANPSGIGYAVPQGAVRPEQNHKKSEVAIRKPDGTVVVRKEMTNGNIQETNVFPGDYPHAKTEAELEAAAAPKKGKGKSDG